MKVKTWWLLVAALAISIYSACELSETGDAGTTDSGTDMGTDQSDAPIYQTYHYVLIEDQEDPDVSSPTSTSGIDIYGVQLVKMGVTYDASQVHACNFGTGDNNRANDCNQALGPPDDTCSPSTDSPTYVSLGGFGGYIIVSFGSLETIEQGNDIRVFECGAEYQPGAPEEYDFYVGVSTDPTDDHWVECMRGAVGSTTCTVPSLPDVPIN